MRVFFLLFAIRLLIIGPPPFVGIPPFDLSQVEPMPNTSRPFVSFKARDTYYFIQGHDMADKTLLQVLLGRELKESEKLTLKG